MLLAINLVANDSVINLKKCNKHGLAKFNLTITDKGLNGYQSAFYSEHDKKYLRN